ncbi:MAG: glutamate ligase domain-containing protein [Planctomycetota bacterium JB042]
MPAWTDHLDDPRAVLHFVGVGGSGMSALAQHRAFGGGRASGSDRGIDGGGLVEERGALEAAGVEVVPQDGSGVDGADVVVASTAVEAAIPDLVRARERGVPIVHRADLLAALVSSGPSIGIAGSSGKSTVTAMVFEILRHAGRDPGLITGGRLVSLLEQGRLGNAWRGAGPLVFEADESDGSLVKHRPEVGVVLNLHRDHMPDEAVLEQYRAYREHVRGTFLVSGDAPLEPLRDGAVVYALEDEPTLEADRVRFEVDGVPVELPLPGRHNAENARAAIAVAAAVGVDPRTSAKALRAYRGVHRRYERIGEARGVVVVDDFAHNPRKLRAVLETAAGRGGRVLAWWQPHGFAPTRFLKDELIDAFAEAVRPDDRLWLAPIYFAGGTVSRDVASDDLVAALVRRGTPAALAVERDRWIDEVRATARDGDVVLVLGARDPTLPALARRVLERLSSP